MKKLLIAILLLTGLTGYGQTNRFPSIDSAKAYVLRFIKTSAVEAFTNYRLQNVQYGTLELIDSLLGAGGQSVDSIWLSSGFATDTLKYSIGGNTRTIGILDRHEGVQSGCRVTYSGVGLIFDVSSGVYYINGTRYTTSGGQVTLDPAHATLDRKDVIGLNSSGPIKITGTAASSPAIPQFGIDTIGLTVVDINAGATIPSGISTTTIYNENTEWTGTASGVTVNFNNTLNVFTGTKAADAGAFTNGQSITFTNGSTVSAADYSDLKFYINLKAAFANNVSLQLAFLNGSTVVSNTVNVTNGAFGFSRITTGTYQKIVIPMSSWNFTNSNFNKLRITFSNGNASGCYLDYINLQQGITQTIITNGNPCLTCFSSTTQLNDSTFTLNRVNGTKDTITINGGADTLWALNSSTIYPKLRRNILIGDSGLVAESPLHHISTSTSVTSQIWQPRNYGSNYYSPSYPYGGRAKRFSNGWAQFNGVNPDGRANVVWFHGYNAAPEGGVIDTGDAGFQFREESHYYNFSEPHFEFHLPEIYDRQGAWHRLFSIYADKVNGRAYMQSQIQDNMWQSTNGDAYADLRYQASGPVSTYFLLQSKNIGNGFQAIQMLSYDTTTFASVGLFQVTNKPHLTKISKDTIASFFNSGIIGFNSRHLDLSDIDGSNSGKDIRIFDDVPVLAQSSALFGSFNPSIPGTLPDASAQIELRTTTKGFLNSRMTGVQMAAISSPATGLLIYNTDSLAFCFYNGTSWVKLAATSGGAGSPGGASTNVQFNNSGAFGGSSNFTWNGTLLKLNANTNVATNQLMLSQDGANLSTGSSIIFNNSNVGDIAKIEAVVGSGFSQNVLSFTVAGSEVFRADYTGNVGFKGVTTPTARVHLPAGTATANTAPLKFTTGTSTIPAAAGQMEYTTPQLFFTNGGGQRQEIPQIQQSRVSTQFDKTSDAALANITGLTATLVAGKTYRFEANLYTTSNSAGGVQAAIAGTATATSIIYEGLTTNAGLTTQGRGTALATSVGAVTAVTAAYIRITGTITVNVAGTLTVQFAQNASNGTASSVLVGSTFVVTEML